jgi:hypothetical protein
MSNEQKHPRGLSDRLLTSGVLPELGLDLLLLAALASIGVSVYRFAPTLVPGYAGVVLLVAWWTIGKTKKGPRA